LLEMSVDYAILKSVRKSVNSICDVTGARTPLFTKNALALVHQASGGILRTLGTVANAALLKAFIAKSPQVEAEHVQAVIQR
jgi:type II secretory pathway predicted ATPase ExeA